MAINLLDMVQSQLGGAAMSQIGKLIGSDDSSTSSAMSAVLPTLLGSVMQKGSSASGAAGLMNMLNDGGHDGGIFDNLGSLLGGGEASNGMMNTGGTILNFLMGNKTQAITDFLISKTSLGKGAMGSMLRLAAPMIIGMIGKQVKKNGLNAKGLMDMLSGQKDIVAKAAPAGLGSILGFSGLGGDLKGAANKAASTVSNTATAAASEGKSMLSKILPIALIAILGIAAYAWYSGKSVTDTVGDATSAVGNTVGDAASAVGDVAGDAASAVGDAAGNAADAVGNAAGNAVDAAGNAADAVADAAGNALDAATAAARKAVESVKFAAGSAGEGLNNMFKSGGNLVGKKVAFKNLTFDTGSATIDQSTISEVRNLAAVLKAYPNYHVEVGGHTDNTGDAAKNMTLSNDRAASVQKTLVALGINADRISTKGYGQTAPTADNGTAAGRQANRRIELTITK